MHVKRLSCPGLFALRSNKCLRGIFFSVTVICILYNFIQFYGRQHHIFRKIDVRLMDRQNESQTPRNLHHLQNQKRRKVILFWTPMFLSADYGFGLGAEPFIVANCEVCNCETTTNRSRLEEADAVVIHPRNIYVNLWDKYGFANTWIKWNLIPIGFMDLPPVR